MLQQLAFHKKFEIIQVKPEKIDIILCKEMYFIRSPIPLIISSPLRFISHNPQVGEPLL